MTKSALPKFLAIFFTCLITWSNADVGFIKNEGQWHENVLYKAQIPMGNLYLEETGITYMFWDKGKISDIHDHKTEADFLNYHVVKVVFEGANGQAMTTPTKPSKDYYNFFIGDDPTKWASGLCSFGKIEYKNIYPNIDLVIDALPLNFKYSFVVHPGGNLDDIKIRIDGASDVLHRNGDIIITTTLGDIVEEAPYSFQGSGNQEIEIPTSFKLEGQHISFDVGEYDSKSPLTIDPNVVFSSLSGSIADNWGFTATYDDAGNAYSGGTVYRQDYGASPGAFSRIFSGGSGGQGVARDCGIFKLNPNGTQRIFTTFLGGVNNEQPHSLVVNESDELLIFGTTQSNNFPNRNGAQPFWRGGWDMFIVKLSDDGKRLISGTFLGGTGEDGINGSYDDYVGRSFKNTANLVWNYGDIYRGEILTDKRDYVYIASTTESNNFPTPGSTFDERQNGQQDAVVAKLSPGLDTIVWASFLGGSADDAAYSLDLDDDGHVFVAGGTKGGTFPTSQGAYNRSYSGGMADAFVAKISNDGTRLLASSTIGSSNYDQAFAVKLDPSGQPWLFGQTNGSFPTKATTDNKQAGMFITGLEKDLSDITISKIIGSGQEINISPAAFSVDLCGRIYIAGWGGDILSTGSTDGLETAGTNADKTTDGNDLYIAVYTKDLSKLIYGTFYGGSSALNGEHIDGGTSRFDKRGVIYLAVCAACGASSFPTTNGAWGEFKDHPIGENCNNGILKIDLEAPAIFAEYEVSRSDEEFCSLPQTLRFRNLTQDYTEITWDMGDGTIYKDSTSLSYTYTKPGTYTIKLIAFSATACNARDTFIKTVSIYEKADADFDVDVDYCTKEVEFSHTGQFGTTFSWNFGDNSTANQKNPIHSYNGEGTYNVSLITDANTGCDDTATLEIEIVDPVNDFNLQLDTCNKVITIKNLSKGFDEHEWSFGDGERSKGLSPSHEYSARGNYDLQLTTNTGLPCEETKTVPIEILEPIADFDLEIDTCLQVGRLTNNSLDAQSYKWDFGFATSTEGNPTVDFPEPDATYTISLVAAPFSACSDTSFLDFRMPNLPEALFDDEADTCVSGTQFTNNSKDAPNWIWYFGNGDSSRAENPFYNYRDTGDFIVTLIAYPNTECSDTFTKLIEIDTFRFALFDVLLDTCKLEIRLVNKSQSLDSFGWRFDDGTTGFGREPLHQYDKDGDYFINLYGLNSKNNCEDSFEQAIFIPPMPEPGNEQFNDSCINTYIFKDTSKFGVKAKWFSSKGDGTVGPEFTVNFPKEGDYTVWQVSESLYGCTDTLEIPIRIDSMPTARFESTIDSCIGAVVTSDNSIGQFRSFWTFGDGNTSRQLSPIVDYEQEGEYTLTLVINQGTECEDTIQETFLIEEYQSGRIFVPNVFTPNGDGINDVFEVGNLRPDCDEYHLFIYNRWGSLVHQDEGTLDPWDGKTTDQVLRATDKLLAPGTYFYVLKGLNITKSGSITIIH